MRTDIRTVCRTVCTAIILEARAASVVMHNGTDSELNRSQNLS